MKFRKPLFFLLLICLISVAASFMLAACGHKHIYTEKIMKATCSEQGYTTYKCNECGKKYIDNYTDALGHDLHQQAAQAATCTEIGWDAYETCSRCDYTTYKEIKALGHDIQEHDAQTETCTEIGWYAYQTCSRCNYSTYEEIKALGHDIHEYAEQAATCTETGWNTYYKCSSCDYNSYQVIPALMEHIYVDGFCKYCKEPYPTLDYLDFKLKKDDTYEVEVKYKNIQAVIIPSLYEGKFVTSISDRAFNGCTLLKSLTIPNCIVSIGNYAFSNCSSLTSIALPDCLTTIGSYAFENCSSLKSLTIPNRVTIINDSTFYGCSNLEEVDIPENVKSIGNYVFEYCSSLTHIIIPDGITSIGCGVFWSCVSLTTITIPDGVTGIGANAFYSCSSLTGLTIPDGVTYIGDRAFSGCDSLTIYCDTIAEPTKWHNEWNYSDCPVVWNCKKNDVANDGNIYMVIEGVRYAIKDNVAIVVQQPTNLNDDIIIKETVTYKDVIYIVTSINHRAFFNCRSMKRITIPNSVNFIDNDAFSYCSLTEIIFNGTQKQWRSIEKEERWDWYFGNYTVHCTDGDIS